MVFKGEGAEKYMDGVVGKGPRRLILVLRLGCILRLMNRSCGSRCRVCKSISTVNCLKPDEPLWKSEK